jgi:hypothetical protein
MYIVFTWFISLLTHDYFWFHWWLQILRSISHRSSTGREKSVFSICLLTEKCWPIALVSPLALLPPFHKLTFNMCFSIFYWRAKCSRSVSWSHFIWFFFVHQNKLGFGSSLSSLEISILCHMGCAQSSRFLICMVQRGHWSSSHIKFYFAEFLELQFSFFW